MLPLGIRILVRMILSFKLTSFKQIANKIIRKVTLFFSLPHCCSDLEVTRTFLVKIFNLSIFHTVIVTQVIY